MQGLGVLPERKTENGIRLRTDDEDEGAEVMLGNGKEVLCDGVDEYSGSKCPGMRGSGSSGVEDVV